MDRAPMPAMTATPTAPGRKADSPSITTQGTVGRCVLGAFSVAMAPSTSATSP